MTEPRHLLYIKGLSVSYPPRDGNSTRYTALSRVDLEVEPGQSVGIVGESGSGKSTLARVIPRLLPSTAECRADALAYRGIKLLAASEMEMRALRSGDIGFVFQNPDWALDPIRPVYDQVEELIRYHHLTSPENMRSYTLGLMREVGFRNAEALLKRYPHQLSGGQKQRLAIALAVAPRPPLLIADEATSALDVTTQRVILDLLASVCQSRGLALLFISHDLDVVASVASKVLVMRSGTVVEQGPSDQILVKPRNSYTRALIDANPTKAAERRSLSIECSRRQGVSEGRSYTENRDEVTQRWSADTREWQILTGLVTSSRDRASEDASLKMKGGMSTLNHRVPLIDVVNLSVRYPRPASLLRREKFAPAVDNIDLHLFKGETLGLVGESGSGKSSVVRAILQLVEYEGEVKLSGRSMSDPSNVAMLRRVVQPVFQNPAAALDLKQTVESIMAEAIRLRSKRETKVTRRSIALETAARLEEVGLEPRHGRARPGELSGGECQRVCLARALAIGPDILLLDESVSALDVLVQAKVLDLLESLREKHELSYIFISHDLSVVRRLAHRIAVMRDGQIVESGWADDIYERPQSDYTIELLESRPEKAGARVSRE